MNTPFPSTQNNAVEIGQCEIEHRRIDSSGKSTSENLPHTKGGNIMPSIPFMQVRVSHFGIAFAALLIAVTLLVIGASPVAAQSSTCMEDVVEQLDGRNAVPLNCTANDVRVGRYNVLAGPSECIEGENVTVLMEAEMVAGASERYDIGLFVALDGGNALRGSC